MTKYLTKNNILWAALWGFVFVTLYLAQSYNYLFFHTTVEVMSVLPSIMIFVIVLYLWNYLKDNNFLSFIGISLFFIGVIDFIHMMAYKGMPIFVGFDSNLPTQLWILARYMQMVSFVIAAILISRARHVNKTKIIIIYTVVVLVMLWSIFISKIFPDAFIEGTGLTSFKVISEYVISIGLLLSGVIIWKKRENFTGNMVQLLLISILFQIFSELSLSSYISVYGFSNFLGHFLKVIWVMLLYRAILGPALESSRELLFKELVASEKQLKESEEKYRLLTENASDVIWVFNLSKEEFSYISPAVFRLTGFTQKEAIQKNLEESMTPESAVVIREVIARNMDAFIRNPNDSNCFIMEIQQLCKNGDIIWVELSAKSRFNAEGQIEFVGISRNIEERKKDQLKNLYLSYHDQLTGLYNRRFYEEELLRLDTKRNLPLTIAIGDINGLKLINDSFGHLMGDELLKRAAWVIKEACRDDDIVARVGGDEFVIILPKTETLEAEKIAIRISKLAKEKKLGAIEPSISFGYETKTSMEQKIEDIFKSAEDHMYRNKLYESTSIKSKTIDIIMSALYEKNPRESLHSRRVSEVCEFIAQSMNLSSDDINQIKIAGLMHDIGKIGLDEKILNSVVKLNEEEWKEIKRHPEISYRILSSANEFSEIADFALAHHERWDGHGYPKGIKGEDIPLPARIIAIADSFDAMTNGRPYKKAYDEKDAIEEIKRCSGSQFDPKIVEVFVKHYKQ